MPMVPDNGPYGFEHGVARTKRLAGHETEYLLFREVPSPGLKTRVWTVESKNRGDVLGLIRWFGQWRQYIFDPADGTVFNATCLSDIESFLDDAMSDWREGLRERHNAAQQGTSTAGH